MRRLLLAVLMACLTAPAHAQTFLGHGSVVAKRQPEQNDGREFGFGRSVLRYDDQLIVGAADPISPVGDLLFYRRVGGIWEEFQRITPDITSGTGGFGYSLVQVDDFIVVGAPFSEVNGLARAGIAQVLSFDADTGEWQVAGTITEPAPSESAYFGVTLASDGNLLFVGAPSNGPVTMDESGSPQGVTGGRVHVYEFDASSEPVHIATLTGDLDVVGEDFGHALAASPGHLVVSARNPESGTGAIHHFDTSSGTPVIAERLSRDDTGDFYFGTSVSIAGDRLLVGTLSHTIGTRPQPGTMVVFEFTPAGLTEISRFESNAHLAGLAVLLLDEQHAVIGAPGYGEVHVYAEADGDWQLAQRLREPVQTTFRSRGFGETLHLSDEQLYVGNPAALHDWGTLPSFYKGGNLYEVPLISGPLADLSLEIVAPGEVGGGTLMDVEFRVRGDNMTTAAAAYVDIVTELQAISAPTGCVSPRSSVIRCEFGEIERLTTKSLIIEFEAPPFESAMSGSLLRAYVGSELADPDTSDNADIHELRLTNQPPVTPPSSGGGVFGWFGALFLLAMLKLRIRLMRSATCSAPTSASPVSTPNSR